MEMLPSFVTPFMVQVAATTAGAQCVLALAFMLMPAPYSKQPGFLAHQIVAFCLVSFMAYSGCKEWFSMTTPDTPQGRFYGTNPVSQMLAQLTFAQLIAWDIPTGLLAPSMQVAAAPST